MLKDLPHRTAARGLTVALLALAAGCSPPPSDPAPAAPPSSSRESDRPTDAMDVAATADGTQDDQWMRDLRVEGWKLLKPFTTRTSGLPAPSDKDKWIRGWTLFPDNSKPSGSSTASAAGTAPALAAPFFIKADLLEVREPAELWEATFFNDVASTFVRTPPRLNQWDTTNQLTKTQLQREIEFPKGSKALKTFWYRLGDKPVEVHVWNWHKLGKDVKEAPLNEFRKVCVVRQPGSSGCLRAEDTFYTATLQQQDLSNFTCGREKCKETLNADDFLILVGMHIATKTEPEWLWATYWWRDSEEEPGRRWPTGASWTCVDAQRKEAIGELSGPWSYYSMDVTASFKRAKPRVTGVCGEPGQLGTTNDQRIAMYNPFVEARFANGLKSSCVHCHAVVNTNSKLKRPAVPGIGQPAKGLALQDFEGHLRLDYVWAVKRSLKPTPANDWDAD